MSGDSFFQKELLTSWVLASENFIAGCWYSFDSGLRDSFGANYFNILVNNLRKMATACDEENF